VDIVPRSLRYYTTLDGRMPFREWYLSLEDITAKVAIRTRLTRVERGLLGDCKPVGSGVFELRFFAGPGYRAYLGFDGLAVVILLCGGDKSSQAKDIARAQAFWMDYRRRKVS
jgi:putative addiction module killer protein